jgi:hypothetical protein
MRFGSPLPSCITTDQIRQHRSTPSLSYLLSWQCRKLAQYGCSGSTALRLTFCTRIDNYPAYELIQCLAKLTIQHNAFVSVRASGNVVLLSRHSELHGCPLPSCYVDLYRAQHSHHTLVLLIRLPRRTSRVSFPPRVHQIST